MRQKAVLRWQQKVSFSWVFTPFKVFMDVNGKQKSNG
jgi:hypothetical protein